MRKIQTSRKLRALFSAAAALISLTAALPAQTPASPAAPKPPAPKMNSYDSPRDIVYPDKLAPTDTRLNFYFGDWRDSLPRTLFGTLVVRDILTPGDNLTPPTPGAVLEQAKYLSYATLGAGERTLPTTLKGEQLFLYVEQGEAEVSGGGKSAPLHKGSALLVPEGLEFTLRNTGSGALNAYLIGDPTFPGFKPLDHFAVMQESPRKPSNTPSGIPFVSDGAQGHWAHITHGFFNRRGNSNLGLASVGSIITVEIQPMTIGEPHPHLPGKEEVWCQIEGNSVAFVGPQLRMQHPGQAYILRPDGLTTHSNLNVNEPGTEPVKFLWFSTNTGLSDAPAKK